MKAGIRFEVSAWRLVLSVDPENFTWTPGEIESGKSSPGEFFDCGSDAYWLWGWMGLTLFFVRVVCK